MNEKKYVVKEILCETELEFFLKLRYKGFCNSAAGHFVHKNSSAIDLNYYDRNSCHYGVYKIEGEEMQPAGYFRIVLEHPTMADKWITAIAVRSGLMNFSMQRPQSIFPCLAVYPDQNLQQHFYRHKHISETAGEVSRFLIVQAERSLKLSILIIKSACAIALLHIQHAFVGCFQNHSGFYMKLGFRQYPDSRPFSFQSAFKQKAGLILYCQPQYLTTELKTGLQKMQDEFHLHKRMTLHL